ncbi:MAG: M3 family oligoendopeptidase [Acholeplasmataceae bacterium]|nr:M3 family oligoendopeptidase [Acholeplasmataceae bacterium]
MNTWNLDDLYKGFDEVYQKDMSTLEQLIDERIALIRSIGSIDDIQLIESVLTLGEKTTVLARQLSGFASLTMATDVTHAEAPKHLARLQAIFRKSTKEDVIFERHLETLDLDRLASLSQRINDHLYSLKRDAQDASHLLSEDEELLYSGMRELASSGWSQLQGLLTSNLSVHYRDKTITLPEVRNLAYDNDPDVRKDAYHAELDAYKQIDDAVALALSNIKREVVMMSKKRGYESPLEKTLFQSRLSKRSLDAMIDEMKAFRPVFERYLKAKARYLSKVDALPFYDLFAPVGKADVTYTYEEAQAIIKDAFYGFSKALGDFASRAFNENWIDVHPKKGKRGGAFCSNQPQIGQSRILTNFTGSLSDVLTLAHELGHGYHGEVISKNTPLKWGYPMPLAETASIFSEAIVNNHLLSKVTQKTVRLAVLENALQGDTQVIIDILSRYLFETELMALAHGPISKHQLNRMMEDAQKEAYGAGLDHQSLNPYMWLNKPHYYSAGLNFYNFPYAFGLLFGKGLYALYQKDPESFVRSYDTLLHMTTAADVEDVAATMAIDVTGEAFWQASLSVIKDDIEQVIALFEEV